MQGKCSRFVCTLNWREFSRVHGRVLRDVRRRRSWKDFGMLSAGIDCTLDKKFTFFVNMCACECACACACVYVLVYMCAPARVSAVSVRSDDCDDFWFTFYTNSMWMCVCCESASVHSHECIVALCALINSQYLPIIFRWLLSLLLALSIASQICSMCRLGWCWARILHLVRSSYGIWL